MTKPEPFAMTGIKRLGEHRNAFGFLRLLFASLVILSHAPELADGNRSRELLTGLFGTVSLGELSVDGFFLVSGYLITGSYLKDPRPFAFLVKRVLRIYPAFLAAWLICRLVIAPLATGAPAWFGGGDGVAMSIAQMLLLKPMVGRGVFPGTPYPTVDMAMWTVAYEFRCYLMTLALGMAGGLRRRWIAPVLGLAALTGFELLSTPAAAHLAAALPAGLRLDWLPTMLRLGGVYLMGVSFFLYRGEIRFGRAGAALAATLLVAGLSVDWLAEPAVATAGAYLVFAAASASRGGLLTRINNRNDISYGVYLYAWPTTKLLLWHDPAMPLAMVAGLTFAIACACGWASWHLLERPIMQRLPAIMRRLEALATRVDRAVRAGSRPGVRRGAGGAPASRGTIRA